MNTESRIIGENFQDPGFFYGKALYFIPDTIFENQGMLTFNTILRMICANVTKHIDD